jgi:hypothetical protein
LLLFPAPFFWKTAGIPPGGMTGFFYFRVAEIPPTGKITFQAPGIP